MRYGGNAEKERNTEVNSRWEKGSKTRETRTRGTSEKMKAPPDM